jgi:hypothetical protein
MKTLSLQNPKPGWQDKILMEFRSVIFAKFPFSAFASLFQWLEVQASEILL